MKNDNRLRVTEDLEVDLSKNKQLLKKVDEMRKKETVVELSRPLMVKIAIEEAYDKRNPSSKK